MPKVKINKKILDHARMMVHIAKMWSPEFVKLSYDWRRAIIRRVKGHKSEERKNTKFNYFVAMPILVMSAIVMSGTFATFQNCECGQSGTKCLVGPIVRLILGFIATATTALTAFSTFFNFSARSESHKAAAEAFSDLVKTIDLMQNTDPSQRENPITFFTTIKNTFSDIISKNKSLPEKYDSDLEYKVLDMKPHKENTVEENLFKRKEELISANNQAKPGQVLLDIDLETARPEDLLEENRERAIRESLARALSFEMQRMEENSLKELSLDANCRP